MAKLRWQRKDLLDTADLSKEETLHLFEAAFQFQEINSRPVKKVPTLRGKGIILFFAENSTRTKTSFDMAGKRLSADTFSLAKSGSSLNKGESLKDTALTLQAMAPDIIVIRHSSSGAAQFIAERLPCSIINAGDGWHAHPTQALLDGYTLHQRWQGAMKNKTVTIVGDIAHSRVARSNVLLLHTLGVNVRLFAPRTLLPRGVEHWPAEVCTSLDKAMEGTDAVMCLRLQLERQQAGLLPNLTEYATRFCLTKRHLTMAMPNVVLMHPGPINRGLELASDLADAANSLILDQISAGVAMRMALLFIYGMRNETIEYDEA